MSITLQEMHRSVGKISDENVVIFIINKVCTAKKAAIILLTTILLACPVDLV